MSILVRHFTPNRWCQKNSRHLIIVSGIHSRFFQTNPKRPTLKNLAANHPQAASVLGSKVTNTSEKIQEGVPWGKERYVSSKTAKIFNGVCLLTLSSVALYASTHKEAQLETAPVNETGEEDSSFYKIEGTDAVYLKDTGLGQTFLGAGLRTMTPFKIKVYAMGMYVDPDIAFQVWGVYKNFSKEQLLESKEFWHMVCESRSYGLVPAVLQMKIVREVKAKHIQHGFDRGLIKRIRYADDEWGLKNGKAALKELNRIMLLTEKYQIGDDIKFVKKERAILEVYVNDNFVGALQSQALCWAFWDMFLGEKPASKEIKEKIAEGIENILREK